MRVSAAAWVGVCALALVGSAGADGKKNKRLEPAGPLGAPEVFPVTGVGEPSGVAWDARRSRLYVVGDDGTLAEMDAAGQTLATTTVGGNLEDVTVHPPTGFLILLAEIPAALIAWDPDARREVARWPLDTAALLGRAASAKQGFEGLFFHAGGSHPGAGVFYLAHQNAPASVITIAFDPSKPGWHAVAQQYNVSTIPAMFLIDRKGVVRSVEARANYQQLIPELLKEKP